MGKINRWIRKIHRWLVAPFLIAILCLLIGSATGGETFTLPVWLNILAIGSLIALLLTGLYMFAQHYWAKWRRARQA